MLSLESFFSRVRQWYISKDGIAFLGYSQPSIFFLSSSNLAPHAWVTHFAPHEDPRSTLEKRSNRAPDCVAALPISSQIHLAVVAACCQKVTILSDDDVVSLACLSKAPFIASIILNDCSEGEGYTSGKGNDGGRMPTHDHPESVVTHNARVAKCLDGLLRRAHCDNCMWQGRRPPQMFFGVDGTLRLEESMVVRARCAAVTVNLIVPQDHAGAPSSPGPKPRSRLLLPRATPPSLLGRDTDEAFRCLMSQSRPPLAYVGSNTNERILGLFFPPVSRLGVKRVREGSELRKESGSPPHAAVDPTLSETDFLGLRAGRVWDVCLLLHLYGYVLERQRAVSTHLPSIDSHDTVEALEEILSAPDWCGAVQEHGGLSNEDNLERDQTSGEEGNTEQVHALMGGLFFCCRFCGGQPPARIDSTASSGREVSTQALPKTVQERTSEPVQSSACSEQPTGEVGADSHCENEYTGKVHDVHSHDNENANHESNPDYKDFDDEESTGENLHEVDEVDLIPENFVQNEQYSSDCSSASEAGANPLHQSPPISKQRCPFTITIPLSVRDSLNGHRDWCPWKKLFLDVVLKGLNEGYEGGGEKAAPPRWVYLDFNVDNSNENVNAFLNGSEHSVKLFSSLARKALKSSEDHNAGEAEPPKDIDNGERVKLDKNTLRFQLDFAEMERLITVWRTSEDLEKRFRYSYLVNPYPEEVRRLTWRRNLPIAETENRTSSIASRSSSSVEMEAFLSNLQKRLDTQGDNARGDIEGPYRAASVVYWPTMMGEAGPTSSGMGEKTFVLVLKALQTLLKAQDSTGMSPSIDLVCGDAADGRIGDNSVTSTSSLSDITNPQLTTLLAEGLMLLRKMTLPASYSPSDSTDNVSSRRQNVAKQCTDFIARMDRECLAKIARFTNVKDGMFDRDQVILDALRKLVKPTIALLYHDYLSPAGTVERSSKVLPTLVTSPIETAGSDVGLGVEANDDADESAVRSQTNSLRDIDSGIGFSNGGSPPGWFWSPASLADARRSVEAFINELRKRQRHKILPKSPHELQKSSTKVSRPSPKFNSSFDANLQQNATDPSKPSSFQNTAQFGCLPPPSSVHFSEPLEADEHQGVKHSQKLAFQPTILTAPSSSSVLVKAFPNAISSTERRESSTLPTGPVLSSGRGNKATRLPSGAHHPTTPPAGASILGSSQIQETQSRRGPQTSHRQFPYKEFRRPLPQPSPPQVPFSSPPFPQESFAFGYPSNTNEFQSSFAPPNEVMYTSSSGGVAMGVHGLDSGFFSIPDGDPNAAPPPMQDSFPPSHLSSVHHTHMHGFANPGNEHYYQPPARYPSGLYSQENQGILDGDPNMASPQADKQPPSQPRRPRRGGGRGGRRRRAGGRGGGVQRGT